MHIILYFRCLHTNFLFNTHVNFKKNFLYFLETKFLVTDWNYKPPTDTELIVFLEKKLLLPIIMTNSLMTMTFWTPNIRDHTPRNSSILTNFLLHNEGNVYIQCFRSRSIIYCFDWLSKAFYRISMQHTRF